MLKRKFSNLGELGSMMVEALAMLGLISMVTPIVYKKAAERNMELQDINAASQVRNLIRGIDEYIQDNYASVTEGRKVQNNCRGGGGAADETDYSNFTSSGSGDYIDVDIRHLCDYLPYGFLDDDGDVSESKNFNSDYKVVVKKVESGMHNKKVLTGFLLANPKQNKGFSRIRSSRISSMIGGNGGYVLGSEAFGVQGMWGVANISNDLGLDNVEDGAILSTSVSPISSGSGAKDEDLLYRTYQADNRSLNTMETTLQMGLDQTKAENIDYINQAVIYASRSDRFIGGTDQDRALWIRNQGGAFVDGVLSVAAKGDNNAPAFYVGLDGEFYASDEKFKVDNIGAMKAADGKFLINEQGDFSAVDGKFVVEETEGSFTTKGDGTVEGNLKVLKVATIGDGVTEPNYTLTVNGDAFIRGLLRVVTLRANNVDAGKLRAGMNPFDDNPTTDPDYTLVADATRVTVGHDKFEIDRATGTTTLEGGNLIVNRKGAPSQKDFMVDGTSGNTYARGFRAGGGNPTDAEFPFEVGQDSNVLVNLRDNTNYFMGEDTSNQEMFLFDNDFSRIQKKQSADVYSRVQAENGLLELSTSLSDINRSRLNLYNDSITMKLHSDTINNDPDLKLSRQAAGSKLELQHNTAFRVFDNNNKSVLFVDTANDLTDPEYATTDRTLEGSRGGVYIRRGVIDLEVNNEAEYVKPKFHDHKDKGYVRADMLISRGVDGSLDKNKYFFTPGDSAGVEQYDTFMVNPAYTSVMHDIKLTSRGGARLSDILPDFINKGIYIVDNTFKESLGNWAPLVANPSAVDIATVGQTHACSGTDLDIQECATSPWLGVVPTPQCPPMYEKAAQVTPYGFNMSVAGIPGGQHRRDDLYLLTKSQEQDPSFLPQNDAIVPLTFQKSTRLRTRVNRVGDKKELKGWSVIMGFIYPHDSSSGYENVWSDPNVVMDNNYFWNLYPVYYRELEAYATVYCYFARKDINGVNKYDPDFVDVDYDQLKRFRAPTDKTNATNKGRLDDPNMKYINPW